MAIKKKALVGAAPSKHNEASGTDKKSEQPAKSAPAKKLAVAKLATAKLSTAKLALLRRIT